MKTTRLILMVMGLALAGAAPAQIHLSGALSGTLGPGEYLVDNTITVNAGDTLIIAGGAHLSFTGWYPFRINGVLLAQGTASDSIKFDCNTSTNPNRWNGLRFDGAGASGSRLSYCRISYGKAQNTWPESCGGAVLCMNSGPVFEHCRFSASSATMYGGGVYCYNATASFSDCIVDYNTCVGEGAGIYASASTLTVTRCHIDHNNAGSGSVGGFQIVYTAVTMRDSRISYNNANSQGGLSIVGGTSSTLTNCLVDHNSATGG